MRDIYSKRRKLSYRINSFDDVNLERTVNYEDVCAQVVGFFESGSSLVYPAKSYFVAIVYAKCFEFFFGEDFLSALDDPELLPDDGFFVPYSQSRAIYDGIFEKIGAQNVLQLDSVQKTVKYFKQEFLLDISKERLLEELKNDGSNSKDDGEMQFRV